MLEMTILPGNKSIQDLGLKICNILCSVTSLAIMHCYNLSIDVFRPEVQLGCLIFSLALSLVGAGHWWWGRNNYYVCMSND